MTYTLITGVSRGVGLALTKSILANGGHVIGISRSFNKELQQIENDYGEHFIHLAYDLSLIEGIKSLMLNEVMRHNICIDGFVNNAAVAYDDIVTNLQIEPLLNMYNVNVFAPMIISKYVIRNMLLNNTMGSIVHISSISVHTGYKGLTMYASSKGALEAFSKNIAREWGVKGLRSNCIVAGFMDTAMSSGLRMDQKEKIYKRTSLKVPTQVSSVVETARFLLNSDSSSAITGQNIFVDSGTI